MGNILHALLEEVLDDPKRNTREYMLKRTEELAKWDDKDLAEIGTRGKQKISEAEEREVIKLREKHWVK